MSSVSLRRGPTPADSRTVHLAIEDFSEARRFRAGLRAVGAALTTHEEPDWNYFRAWAMTSLREAEKRLTADLRQIVAVRMKCWDEFLVRVIVRSHDLTDWQTLYDLAVSCFPALWVLDEMERNGGEQEGVEVMAVLHFTALLAQNRDVAE